MEILLGTRNGEGKRPEDIQRITTHQAHVWVEAEGKIKREKEATRKRERENESGRGRIGGYIKTGAGACQVLHCTQCISVRQGERTMRRRRMRGEEEAYRSRNAA